MALNSMGGRWKQGKWIPEKRQEALNRMLGTEESLAQWDHVTTIEEACQLLQHRFPHIDTKELITSNFEAVPMAAAMKQFEILAAKYPQIADGITKFGTDVWEMDGGKMGIAKTLSEGKGIVFNTKLFQKNPKIQNGADHLRRLNESIERSYKSGKFVYRTLQEIIIHENGHTLHRQLISQHNKTSQEQHAIDRLGEQVYQAFKITHPTSNLAQSPSEAIADLFTLLETNRHSEMTTQLSQIIASLTRG